MNEPVLTLSFDAPTSGGRQELRRSIRRLGDFSRTVDTALGQFNTRYGVNLALTRRSLTRAFLEWVRRFDAERVLAGRDRRDFSHFAAGILLASLIRNRPVTASEGPSAARGLVRPEEALVAFWPEGVFYFEFCITVLDKVLAEQDLEGIHLSAEALELRSWASFRENVASDPDLAIPFLDLFLGGDPNWDFPKAARFRSALKGRMLDWDKRLEKPGRG
ncbi:hypothetical protein [Aureimonas sp. SK2]|uniref:hypothetical protein n=1 Tax=Aureimonas sp. SK2 TaxID=3015992 RepID=UPI0024450EFF|nr:hypothetical protein [Aureimonas sp. SK2]